MITSQSFSSPNEQLIVEKAEEERVITLRFRGKSNERNPGEFLGSILDETLTQSRGGAKPIEIDFTDLEYMNSSTITPIIKVLDQAKAGQFHITLRYAADKKWQQLSFTALKIFETKDGRIRIVGA